MIKLKTKGFLIMQNIGKKLEQFFLSNSTVIAIIESPYFKMYENL